MSKVQQKYHGPGGLSRMVEHLRELKSLGAPETVINALVQELIDQFPHLARAIDPGIANIDKAGAIIGELGRITSNSIDLLKSGSNLVPGEMPPHILAYLLNEGVNITQIHDPSLHGDLPPHVRHFESQYHGLFCIKVRNAP